MKKLFEKINNEGLTQKEKEQGFLALQNFISKNKPKEIKSPFYNNTFFILVRQRSFAIPVALFLIIIISSGTVLASQNSLPGDILYPVKLLSEGVESATTLSVKSKAEVQAKHAITRLAEVEKLAVLGDLSSTLGTEVSKQFQVQAQQATQDIATLKDSGALIDAAKISSSFESSLVGHEERMRQLDNIISKKTRRDGLSNIVTSVQNQIEITSSIQDSLDSSIATSSNKTAARNYAEDRLRSSQKKIFELEKHVASSSPENQIGSEINLNINDAQNIINQSQKKIGEGSLNDAFKLLRQADQAAEKAAEIHDSGTTTEPTQNTDQINPTQENTQTIQRRGNEKNRNQETTNTRSEYEKNNN